MERPTSSASTARRLRTDLLYTVKSSKSCTAYRGPLLSPAEVPTPGASIVSPAVPRVLARPVDRLELLERTPRPHGDACERRLREVAGHLRLVPEALVESLQQRPAARQHDAAVHDVGRELRRRAVERLLDRADDLADGLLERAAHLLRGEHHG